MVTHFHHISDAITQHDTRPIKSSDIEMLRQTFLYRFLSVCNRFNLLKSASRKHGVRDVTASRG